MKPTIGRIVHYRGPGTSNGQFQPKTYPAIITTVHTDSCVNLFVMTDVGHMNINSCEQGENADIPSCWTWPSMAPAAPAASGRPAYQQRVIDEKAELDDKLSRLKPFFETPVFAGLPDDEKSRLSQQCHHMEQYSSILEQRISAFAA